MAKEVIRYEAEDGSLWTTPELADHYESQLDLMRYIDGDECSMLCSRHGGESLDGSDFLEWINENKRLYCVLLPEEPKKDDDEVEQPDDNRLCLICQNPEFICKCTHPKFMED